MPIDVSKYQKGIATGWLLLLLAIAIGVIAFMATLGANRGDVRDEEQVATTTGEAGQAVEEQEGDPSTWRTFSSTEYGFSMKYPNNWEAATTSDPTPVITFYKTPSVVNTPPPYIHHDETVHVSLYPQGVPTEGVFGRTATSTVSAPESIKNAIDFVLEDGKPWATMLTFTTSPRSWNGAGFMFARTDVRNLQTKCLKNGVETPMEQCDPLDPTQRVEIIRTGEADEAIRQTELEMIRSLQFIR